MWGEMMWNFWLKKIRIEGLGREESEWGKGEKILKGM